MGEYYPYFSEKSVCETFKVCRQTVASWARKGKIKKLVNPRNKRVVYDISNLIRSGDDLLTISEVCSRLCLSVETLRKLRKQGYLEPTISISSVIRYSLQDVNKFKRKEQESFFLGE